MRLVRNAVGAVTAAIVMMAVVLGASSNYAHAQESPQPDYAALLAQLDEAVERWEQNSSTANYIMVTRSSCFCPPESFDNTTTVANGQVTFSNPSASGWTVERIFESIRSAIDRQSFTVGASYNEDGVPISASWGPDPEIIADGSFAIRVSDFEFTGANGEADRLAEARAKWSAAFGSDEYSMTYRVSCECLPAATVPQTIWVDDGAVALRISSQGVIRDPEAPTLTVGVVFAIIDDAIAEAADDIGVSYHPVDGYPESVYIDYDVTTADEEFSYSVSAIRYPEAFVPLLTDVYAARDGFDLPAEPRSVNYTRTCTISEICAANEAATSTVAVDLQPADDGSMTPTGFLPQDTNQPVISLERASHDLATALEYSLSQLAQLGSDRVGINLGTTPASDYAGWAFYELALTIDDEEPQILRYRLNNVGPFGCCQPPEVSVVYAESFESGLNGWVTWKNRARTGEFGVGTPQQTFARQDDVVVQPSGASDGDKALVTDYRFGGWAGRFDIDKGYVYAFSPGIPIPANARLSIDWYWGHASSWDGQDSFIITVESGPADGPVDMLETVVELTDTGVREGKWQTASLDLSSFANRVVNIRVVASDVGTGSLSEAGIDNIVITAGVQPQP